MWIRNYKLPAVAAILGVFVGAFACGRNADEQGSSVKANGVPVGDLRGTTLVNKVIRTRVLDAEQLSSGTFEVERLAGNEIYQLRALLGQFADGGSSSEWRGGEPNPFGMLLWHQVLSAFAKGLATSCDAPDAASIMIEGQSLFLNSSFKTKLLAVCALEGDDAAKKAAVSKLWRATVGLAASDEEKAFLEIFVGSEAAPSPFAAASPTERVEAMLLAMTMNPHFLLEK